MRLHAMVFLAAAGMATVASPGTATAQIVNAAPGQAAPEAGLRTENTRLFHRTRIIVKFAPGAEPTAVMAAAVAGDRESFREGATLEFAEQGSGAILIDLSAAAIQTESNPGSFGIERINGAESTRTGPLDDLIARLNADPRVDYAQKNYLMQPFQTADLINDIIGGRKPPNDPYLAFQWHLKRHGERITAKGAPGAVNFPAAWEKFTPRRNMVVAVVDAGQYFDHDDVNAAVLLPGYDFVSDPFVGNDGDGRDGDATDAGDGAPANACFPGSQASESSWHGSHVSGIAGLAASNNDLGIASPVPGGVAFVPVRALGRCGGYTTDLVDALLWAAGIAVPGAPTNPNPAQVVNASFGGPSPGCDPAFRDALTQLKAAGAVLVAAGGNESDDSRFYSPSGCSDAVTVAASDMMGALAPYAYFGDTVDILAAGCRGHCAGAGSEPGLDSG